MLAGLQGAFAGFAVSNCIFIFANDMPTKEESASNSAAGSTHVSEAKPQRGRPKAKLIPGQDGVTLNPVNPVVKRSRGRPRSTTAPNSDPLEKKKQVARANRRRAREALKLSLSADPNFKRGRGRPAIPRVEPRPVGRPPGATDSVTAPELTLSINEFSAVRAYLQGIDCIDIYPIYFPLEPRPSSESAAIARIITLLRLLVSAAASRRGDNTAAELKGTTFAAETLQLRLIEAEQRRSYLLERAKIKRDAKAPDTPATKTTDTPHHLSSVDVFVDWYIRTNLDGNDPDFGSAEWLEIFSEAVDDHRATAPESLSPPEDNGANEENIVLSQLSENSEATHSALFYGAQALMQKTGFVPGDIDTSLKALDWMRSIVIRPALKSDLVDIYFTAATTQQLKAADIFTLYQLTNLVNRRGRMWWSEVAGLGPKRAARVNDWLCTAGSASGLEVDADLRHSPLKLQMEQKQRSEKGIPRVLLRYGLGPLAILASTHDLDGSSGVYRATGNNMLGAENDLEAVMAALSKYNDSPRTQEVYGREMCRFIRWCLLEKKKPMSSVSIPEAREYKEFLDDLPQSWINPTFVLRGADRWMPFRGQLKNASKRKALTAVNVIYGQLVSAGYLTGNPMVGVLKGSRLGGSNMNVSHALTVDQWRHIENELAKLPNIARLDEANHRALALVASAATQVKNEYGFNPGQHDKNTISANRLQAAQKTIQGYNQRREELQMHARRLQAIFMLLKSTGLRRDECFHARLDDLETIKVDGRIDYLLTVIGKGDKQRVVMVPENVIGVVMNHLSDRKALGFKDDLQSKEGRKNVPLISVIGKPVTTWTFDSEHGADVSSAPVVSRVREFADTSGALSPEGMYRLAKTFFKQCATTYENQTEREHFLQASLHWLRHTFGTTMADVGVDLRTIQRQMGHSNINTTAHYSKKDDKQMVRELRVGHSATNAFAEQIEVASTQELASSPVKLKSLY